MAQALDDCILERMSAAGTLYHRLVLVAGPSRSGKTTALQHVSERSGAPLINVNLELSRRLLDLTERQRALRVPRLLDEIVNQTERDEVLLDNNEILFDVQLMQDPLRLLQGLSRSRTLVASWNGHVTAESLMYAASDHEEYRQYSLRDLTVVSCERLGQP